MTLNNCVIPESTKNMPLVTPILVTNIMKWGPWEPLIACKDNIGPTVSSTMGSSIERSPNWSGPPKALLCPLHWEIQQQLVKLTLYTFMTNTVFGLGQKERPFCFLSAISARLTFFVVALEVTEPVEGEGPKKFDWLETDARVVPIVD